MRRKNDEHVSKTKKLKVQYGFDELGYPFVISNLIQDDFDMLDLLLSGDLPTHRDVLKFERVTLKERKAWWSNATKVYLESEDLEISSACGFVAVVRISLPALQRVLADWKKFLTHKVAFDAEY